MTHRAAPPLMMARRLGWGFNPLRRGSDRVESLVVMLATTIGLLAIPAAAAFGTTVHKTSLRDAAEQAAVNRPVVARTVESVPPTIHPGPVAVTVPVRATWTDSSGTTRETSVAVPPGTREGAKVTIWVDRAGQPVAAPQGRAHSAAVGIAAGLGTLLGVELALWLLVVLVRRPLNQWRLRSWETEWTRVEPRWTGRART